MSQETRGSSVPHNKDGDRKENSLPRDHEIKRTGNV